MIVLLLLEARFGARRKLCRGEYCCGGIGLCGKCEMEADLELDVEILFVIYRRMKPRFGLKLLKGFAYEGVSGILVVR